MLQQLRASTPIYHPLRSLGLIAISCASFFIAPTHAFSSDIAATSSNGLSLSQKMEQLNKERSYNESSADLRGIQNELALKRKELKRATQQFSLTVLPLSAPSPKETSEQAKERQEKLQAVAMPQLDAIRALQATIRSLEEQWKETAKRVSDIEEEDFEGLWHQPDTSLGQLIIDYNDSDAVYVMPPEIAAMKVHLSSHLTIPKASWTEMLELIMAQMGIGVKQIMPFVKQLYFLRINQSGLTSITDDRLILQGLSEEAKVAFVLAPPSGDLRRVYQFLEKFSPQEQMAIQVLGGQIVVVGLVREVNELLKIYDFITSPKRMQEYRFVSLEKADSEEVAKILLSIFEGDNSRGSESSSYGMEKPMSYMMAAGSGNDLSFGFRVIPMKHPASSLFLMGKAEQIEKACQIIHDIEANIGEVQDKTIYWYACQHSESEELAKVLSQVYVKLLGIKGISAQREKESPSERTGQGRAQGEQTSRKRGASSTQPQDSLIVQSSMVSMGNIQPTAAGSINENFIVDPKTNSIIMVVENFVLAKLKDLVKKLDVPKRMVQIDVLMFEKRVSDASSFGLNLLKTGYQASGKHRQGFAWNEALAGKKGSSASDVKGILQFAVSRGKSGALPPYELAYQFLLSQEDIQINANPSVVTVNQTPAKIAVVDQISINTGAVEFNEDHFKNAYSRAEYGIIIQITPTVHAKLDHDSDLEDLKYVTLATEIIFDTTRPDRNERPEVTRRNIKNEVRVKDGETVILGGLRKKHSTGNQQAIPFLGELPGIGKLFSTTALSDSSTEMFIFITPKIIPDNREAMHKLRYEQLIRRPGDIPEFLEEIEKAKEHEKKTLFERSLKMIFSPPLTQSTF